MALGNYRRSITMDCSVCFRVLQHNAKKDMMTQNDMATGPVAQNITSYEPRDL